MLIPNARRTNQASTDVTGQGSLGRGPGTRATAAESFSGPTASRHPCWDPNAPRPHFSIEAERDKKGLS